MNSADLEVARARLVSLYRANKRLWPDGIDSKGDRWYEGHEAEWTKERIAKALGNKGGSVTTVLPPVTSAVTTPKKDPAARLEKKKLAMRRLREARKALTEATPK